MGSRPGVDELARTNEPQMFYDEFYAFSTGLLDEFYPERTVTVTSRDPSYVTPEIKMKLRSWVMSECHVLIHSSIGHHLGKEV